MLLTYSAGVLGRQSGEGTHAAQRGGQIGHLMDVQGSCPGVAIKYPPMKVAAGIPYR